MKPFVFFLFFVFVSCSRNTNIFFHVKDTDFSKGRLKNEQTIELNDLVKFHGHLCDGLVLGSLAIQEALKALYGNDAIDRTNLRIVCVSSPCITDVAIYITGGRYQFNTFFVDNNINAIYVVQRIDNSATVSVKLNKGIKPRAIDSLGLLAMNGKLSSCGLDSLKRMEDEFTQTLLKSEPKDLFTVAHLSDFKWSPVLRNDFLKSDVLNKNKAECNE